MNKVHLDDVNLYSAKDSQRRKCKISGDFYVDDSEAGQDRYEIFDPVDNSSQGWVNTVDLTYIGSNSGNSEDINVTEHASKSDDYDYIIIDEQQTSSAEESDSEVQYTSDLEDYHDFSVGDSVKLSLCADKFKGGSTIPSWVKFRRLYVREVSGDFVLIGTKRSGYPLGYVEKKFISKAD